jgi:hypothetical protein
VVRFRRRKRERLEELMGSMNAVRVEFQRLLADTASHLEAEEQLMRIGVRVDRRKGERRQGDRRA